MSSDEAVLYHADGAVAVITLNRPSKRNAISPDMRAKLSAYLDKAMADSDIAAIVLAAAGESFGAGQDLAFADDIEIGAEALIEQHIKPLIMKINAAPKPVISAVNGACVGVSASIALSCDLCVMEESAFFYMAFANLGLVPDGGISWHLVRHLGIKRAYQVVVESARIDSATALSCGLVNKVVGSGDLFSETIQWAQTLSRSAPLSLRHTKSAMQQAVVSDLEKIISIEARLQGICADSADSREAIQAFREKRRARFRGF